MPAAEQRFREALAAVQAAASVLDEEVFVLDSTQGVLQAGKRVFSPVGGDVGQLLSLVGRVQGQPLMTLPGFLLALGEQAGMVTTIEGGDCIPANLAPPGGPVDVNERKAARARRIDELAKREA